MQLMYLFDLTGYLHTLSINPPTHTHTSFPRHRDEWPADNRAHYCTNFAMAVPAHPATDVLLENWTKPDDLNPIVNGEVPFFYILYLFFFLRNPICHRLN